MKVLVVNAGSSSLKYQLIEMNTESVICKGVVERIGISGSKITHKITATKKEVVIDRPLSNHTEAFNLLVECLLNKDYAVISSVEEIAAIGHRFVNPGEEFTTSTFIGDKELKVLESIVTMAPLHNQAHIDCIKSCKSILPTVPNVCVFDTSFHQTMPNKAKLYGIPYEDYQEYKIRRYGFHGTSHKFVSQEAIKYLDSIGAKSSKIITCHLGNGSSISAVKDGKCVDTSMGMTPLAGVLMGTRSGDIDPSAVEMLAKMKGMNFEQAVTYLNKKSGFLGVSGVSSDCRDVYNGAKNGDERCLLTTEMFSYTVKKYIGSYAAALNGLDAIVFTGGIGENSADARYDIMVDMDYLGIDFDFDKNASRPSGEIVELTKKDSKVKVLVIQTNEELVIARETKAIVESL